MTMILDPKEIDIIVKSINKSLQVYSIDDITVIELSKLIFTKLVGNGVSARIIEYTFNGKPFQSVQYYKQKTWFNFDYSGLDMFFQPVYGRTLDPQNIVKEELVDVQYATPEYPEESDDTDVTQEQVNNGVTNWILSHLSNFTFIVTTAVNNYLSTHSADFKGNDGATGTQGPKGDKGDTGPQGPSGPAGPGFQSGTYRIPQLIESKQVTNVNSIIFNNLDINSNDEYLLTMDLKSSAGGRVEVVFNDDTTISPSFSVSHYENFNVYTVEDTPMSGISNWGSPNTLTRLYGTASKSSWGEFKIKNIPNGGLSIASSTTFNKGGGVRSFLTYINPNYAGTQKIALNITDGATVSGNMKLYKMVDMVIS